MMHHGLYLEQMMEEAPSPLIPLDHQTLWKSLKQLLERVIASLERDTFLDECLDAVVEILGADRGLIILSNPQGSPYVINARGQERALAAVEREEICRTIIDQVEQTGEPVVWDPEIEIEPSESMAMLGILTALAAPLFLPEWQTDELGRNQTSSRNSTRGVLYVDVRDYRKAVGPLHIEFFLAAASLISIVLEQSNKLQLVEETLRAAQVDRVEFNDQPTFEEQLRPKSMAHMRREIESCLFGESSILLLGPSGVGKTVMARGIAEASGRKPIVRAMLGASDDLNTITSELFGHERGAYTGALAKRVGMVEHADKGTLILDEILNLSPQAQQLLLDFTQFGTYRPLGYDRREPRRAKTRIIAATNGDMEAALRSGRFRQDLYFRLAAVTIRIPALSERREDIPSIALGLLRRVDRSRQWRLSVPFRRLLLSTDLPWPGNIRQLEGVIRRARVT